MFKKFKKAMIVHAKMNIMSTFTHSCYKPVYITKVSSLLTGLCLDKEIIIM